MENRKLEQTRLFLLDMDGTFYLEDELLPGASGFIPLLQELGRDYLFLTNNSSKSADQYGEKLRRLGLPVPDTKIFTSGQATAIYLSRNHPGARVEVFGTPALEDEFVRHGFQVNGDDPQVVVFGFDTTLTYAKLWRLCNLVRAGLPYFATHPDINCPAVGGFMPDIGAMIACIEASTGRRPDLIIGKPNQPIVEAIAQKTGLPPHQLCMVGDRLYTDIALGNAGITTILVLSGETRSEEVPQSPFQPDLIVKNLEELSGILASVKWQTG